MKKSIKIIAAIIIVSSLSSCATIFGGPITASQRAKPSAGEPQRKVRVVALIADILIFWPGAIVDFATAAIYRPERSASASIKKSEGK